LNGLGEGNVDLVLTKDQFQELQVQPPPHSHENFTVTMSVTSYEVDEQGYQLDGVDGAPNTTSVMVYVQAVTDDVTLTFSGEEGSTAEIDKFATDTGEEPDDAAANTQAKV